MLIKFKLSKLYWVFLILIFFCLTSLSSDNGKLSFHFEVKRLHQGKVITVVADVFFRSTEGIMIIHYLQPSDYFFTTNSKGEVKIYYPQQNEVVVQQNQMLSSENDVLYSFLSNQHADMGLKSAGYILTSSRTENFQLISTWTPPINQSQQISKIELVHENYLPIYTALFGPNGKIIKKTFYSNYYKDTQSPFPTRIVEIDYLPKGDSILSKKVYSNINKDINSPCFNFEVPANAKFIKNNSLKN
jgi:hypothetical protein